MTPEIETAKPPCAVTYMLELDEAELTVLWGALQVNQMNGRHPLTDECLAGIAGKVTRLLGGF